MAGPTWTQIVPAGVVVAGLLALGVSRCELAGARKGEVTAQSADRVDQASVKALDQARAADDRAASGLAADEARRAAQAASLQESTNAFPSHPASPRQRARLECVHDEQAAAAAGRPVPACGAPRPAG